MSLIITCPICGKRDGYEFRFGGEERGPRPVRDDLAGREWCEVVHKRSNIGGVQEEWWYHRDGCGVWFTIRRDTLTNTEDETAEERP